MATLRYTFTNSDIAQLREIDATINGVKIVVGSTVSDGDYVKLIAPKGKAFKYSFDSIPKPLTRFVFPSSDLRFNYSNNSTIAEIKVDLGNSVEVATNFYAITGQVQIIIDRYFFSQSDIDLLESQNIVMTKNGSPVIVGTTVRNDDLFIAKCPNNRIFYEDSSFSSIRFQIQYGGGFVEFNINEKGNEATCVFQWPNSGTYKVSNFICKTQIVTHDVVAYNGVYYINDAILNDVNKKRFVTYSEEGNTRVVDYGAYIINVISLPFKIAHSVVSDEDTIILGALNTGVKAPIITTDNYLWDLGSITTPLDNNNSFDYYNTNAILNLPYCDPINLDLNYVLGQTISITYTINLYKGHSIVNIHSTFSNSVFITKNIDLGIAIPFINPLTTDPENLNIVFAGDNGVKTPFIDLVRYDLANSGGKFSIPIIDESKLNMAEGYVEVDKIEMATCASLEEVTQLLSILRNGVFL